MIKKLIKQSLLFWLILVLTTSFARSQEDSALANAMKEDVGSTGAEAFTFENDTITSLRAEERAYLVLAQPYDDFELSIEYWIEPDTNSGVYVRCQDADAITATSCYEINIWDANENADNRTGSIVNFTPPMIETNALEHWVSMTIRAEGERLSVTINGQTTADLNDQTYADGHIAFQYGGENGLVKFRNATIKEL